MIDKTSVAGTRVQWAVKQAGGDDLEKRYAEVRSQGGGRVGSRPIRESQPQLMRECSAGCESIAIAIFVY